MKIKACLESLMTLENILARRNFPECEGQDYYCTLKQLEQEEKENRHQQVLAYWKQIAESAEEGAKQYQKVVEIVQKMKDLIDKRNYDAALDYLGVLKDYAGMICMHNSIICETLPMLAKWLLEQG